MRKSFGFVITLFFVGMMGCGGGNRQSSGSPQVPAAPTTLTASAGNTQVALSWGASANASGYHVKRGQASGGPYTLLADSATTSYTDSAVSSGTTYYYVVSAYNSAGESGNSNEAKATVARSPTTYYVSPTGSDSSPGTQAQPFATVQKGANQLLAGDTLILRAGNYHETVTVSTSGTANAPITIQAYAGECPVLIGATAVTGWSVSSGAIYTASWPTQPVQVFGAGQLLNEARWPNTAVEDYAGMTYATADSGTQDYITSSALPDVDLTGAWVHVMAGQSWVVYDRQVTAHDRASGKLTFSSPVNAVPELVPRRGNHFIVFGKLELLDSPGEWWWDPSAQRLYVWMPDGGSPEGRVEAGTAPSVLSLAGQSYVTVSGLSARGGWFNLQNSTHCTVRQFHLKAPTWTRIVNGFAVQPEYLGGVDLSGSGNLVDGGLVQLAGRSSIHDAGTGNTVQQVTVEDSGWNWGAEGAIDLSGAQQALVQNNTSRRTTDEGIYLAPQSRVLNNLVEAPCLFVGDCGDVYVFSMDGKQTEIAYNILRSNNARWSAGVYLDAGSKNFRVHDNLVDGITWSGVNLTDVNDVENNTFLDLGHQSANFVPGTPAIGADWSAGRFLHNQTDDPFPLAVMLTQPTSIIPDYTWYTAYTTLAPQPGPRRVEVDWSQMAQGAWSQNQVPLDLSAANGIMFGFDYPVASFSYTISNLRLLPAGGSGDAGAVPVTGTTWTVSASGGSTCTLTSSGPAAWGASGTSVFNGQNSLTAPLPPNLTDLSAYRGFAFELAGTASRTFDFQGYQAADNGPDQVAGRGATLPASVGADLTYITTGCLANSATAPEPATLIRPRSAASSGLSGSQACLPDRSVQARHD